MANCECHNQMVSGCPPQKVIQSSPKRWCYLVDLKYLFVYWTWLGNPKLLEDLPLPVATCGNHIQKKARPRCLPTWDLYCELVKKKATRGAAPRDVEDMSSSCISYTLEMRNGSAGFNVTSKAGCGECPKSGSGLKPQVFQRKLLIVSPMMMMILFHLQTACIYFLYCRK